MLGATGNLTWNIVLLSRKTGYLVRPADHLALDVEARLNPLAYGSPEEVILDVFLLVQTTFTDLPTVLETVSASMTNEFRKLDAPHWWTKGKVRYGGEVRWPTS